MKTKKVNMKDAVIEQIMLWLVLVSIFVTFLFFVIEYSTVLRIKDNADALADYGARMVALGKTEAETATGLNNIKLSSMATITDVSITCTEDAATSNYQVQFSVNATFTGTFYGDAANNIRSKSVVFNESSDLEKSCTLALTFN